MKLEVLYNLGDPIVAFAFWLGLAVGTLAVLMLAVILVMRAYVLRRDRVDAAAVARWRDILVHPTEKGPIPALARRELTGFLQVWNEVHEPLAGRSTPYLQRVARETHLEGHLRRRITFGGFHTRLTAMVAMGHLRDAADFSLLEGFLDDRNPVVSLCAARALMQIDPNRAVQKVVPQIVRRGDWSQGSIAAILSEAGAEKVSKELSGAALQASVDVAPRLIRFLAGVNADAAAPIIRNALTHSKDERLISTCLQVMTNRNDLDCVRPLLAHPRWHVRMQAAVTLGRLGVAGDDDRLIGILADAQWWVRYRAAQALLKMPFIGSEGLKRIREAQTDHYARDIIQHVLAEQAMGLSAQTAEAS